MKVKRVLFILNPIAGKGHGEKLIPKLKEQLTGKGIYSELVVTERKGHAVDLAEQASGHYDIITAVGGDGTISEVANGLKELENNILGIIPCGSGNDYARTLHINESLEKDVDAVFHPDHVKLVDLGLAEITTADSNIMSIRFLNSFGIGFDALVTKIIQNSKYLRGLPLYLSAVFKALFSYHSSELAARFDNVRIQGTKLIIAIGNGPTSGGGFKLNPTADPMDGILDGCIIDNLSRIRIVLELPKAILGIHTKLPFVKMVKFKNADIEIGEPVLVHADGDLISESAVKIRLSLNDSKIRVVTNV